MIIIETHQKAVTINNGLPNTDPQPVIDKPNKQSRKLITIILLIIFLLLCGGVFAIYINKVIKNEKPIFPTPNPTSDWKTYTNNSKGISFKYPQNWYLRSDSKEGFSISSTNPEMGGNLAGISMRMKTYPTTFNDSTFMKRLEEEYLSFGHGNVEENKKALRTVLIAGIKAYSGDSDAAPENLWDHYYFFYHNNKIYDITATEDIGFPERKESELFNQILSTFRFMEEDNLAGNTINIKFVDGTDITNPISLLPTDIQTSIESIKPLSTLDSQKLQEIDKTNIGLHYWFSITVKSGIDTQQIINQLKRLDIIKYVEKVSIPVPPPNKSP